MNILTIDTVLDKTYIGALFEGKEILKTIKSDEINYHSVYLVKVLNEIYNGALNKIEYLGANTGVGSFTGIRVGLGIAKVISNRLNIKTVPFNTVEALSRAYQNKNIMLDARRNSVFYSNDGKNISMISFEKAIEILENSNTEFICDNSFLKNPKVGGFKLISYEKEEKDLAKFELELVKEKIQNGEITDYNGLKPTYLQTPPIFSK